MHTLVPNHTHRQSKIKMKPVFKQKMKGKLNEDASFTVQQLNHKTVHTIYQTRKAELILKTELSNIYSKQNDN